MAKSKIVSLIFIVSILYSKVACSDDLYVGIGHGYAGVVSEDKVYNGANDWTPRFITGLNWGRMGVEFSIAKYELEDVYTFGGDKFDIKLEDVHWLLGLKIAVTPNVLVNIGANGHNFSSYNSSQNPNKVISNGLDKHAVSYFIGGGFFGEIFSDTIGRVELNYYRADVDTGMLAIDFSLAYRYLIF